MSKSIYISCPITVTNGEKIGIMQRLYNICGDATISYWVKDTPYDAAMITDADIVVIVHPINLFKYTMPSLPVGVRKEFERAIKEKKKIYGAYRNVTGEYNFYEIGEMKDGLVSLVIGTTASIVHECTDSAAGTSVFDVEMLTDRITVLKKDELLLLLR